MKQALVVNGTTNLRFLYAFHLRELGWNVVAFHEYHAAVEYLLSGAAVDVIFANTGYPYRQDVDFILQIKQIYPKIPIVTIAMLKHNQHPAVRLMQAVTAGFMFAPMHKSDFAKALTLLGLGPPP